MQANRNLLTEILQRRRLTDFLVDTLHQFEVKHIFGMPAESLNPIIDAVRRNGRVKLVTVRHEGSGALMASAYAKLTNRLGVCMGTAGPGASHLPIGTYDAQSDGAPVLAISGQVPVDQVGSFAFQEIDPISLFRNSTGLRRFVGTAEQASLIPMVCADCVLARRPGLLVIPADVLSRPISSDLKASLSPKWLDPLPRSSPRAYEQIASRLRDTSGPTVILVGAVTVDVRPAVERLADRLHAPIVIVPAGIHYSVGDAELAPILVTAKNRANVQSFLRRARKVVVVGSMSVSIRALVDPSALIIHVAPAHDAVRQIYGGAIRVCGSLVSNLENIATALKESPVDRTLRSESADLISNTWNAGEVSFWRALNATLPANAILALEPGQVLESAFHHLPIQSRTVTSSFEFGARGYALPAAIAASFALPGRQCVAIGTADGYAQSMAELLTAKKYGLPITAICMPEESNQRPPINFAQFARSSQVRAFSSNTSEDLADTFRIALQSDSSTLIEVSRFSTKAPSHAPSAQSSNESTSIDKGADFATWIVDGLARAGVDRIYGRERPVLRDFLKAIGRDNRLQFFDVQHVESASMMASANSKRTGALSVCLAADDSDLPLLLNGLYDAAFDHAPVLVVTSLGDELLDPTELLEDLITLSVRITPDSFASAKLAQVIAEALRGPSVVHIMLDWSSMLDRLPTTAQWISPHLEREYLRPSDGELTGAVDQLLEARNPAILVGRGAAGARTEIESLAALLQAPIVTTMPGRSVLPLNHPYAVGGIGASGHRTAIDVLERCDVLIIVGSSNRGAIFGLEGPFSIIQIDVNPLQFERSKRKIRGLFGTARETLQELISKLEVHRANHVDRWNVKEERHNLFINVIRALGLNEQLFLYPQDAVERFGDGWTRRLLQGMIDSPIGGNIRRLSAFVTSEERVSFRKRHRNRFESWIEAQARLLPSYDLPIAPPFVPRLVQEILEARGGQRAIVTVDVGLTTLWVYRHFVPSNHEILWTSSFATMGFALPAALAIKDKTDDRPVIAFVGDGGIGVTMAELATAATRKLPIVVIVMNNGKLGAVKFEQEVMGWPEFGPSLYNCDFAQYAQACGVRGFHVRTLAELRSAFSEALDSGQACLLGVLCDADYLPSPPKIHIRQSGGYFLALLRETLFRS